ncbi:hypothetical protein [Bacillus sp. UNCCL81]|uniref:hypothetical protein n=1 Tax=Bacillus sp. UNCCL81 TaxID=1502755 RepID=UPI000413E487|nr:hypothetical protein [Bacillus sp. UNCCL81]SFD60677.1 hypothetical protein SAMN02799633_04259 [Bacillus sp. UNCCL81]
MAKEIKRIQVIFNIVDPHQKEIYDYIMKSTNYSGTAKSLIDVGYILKSDKKNSLRETISVEHRTINEPNVSNFPTYSEDELYSPSEVTDFSGYVM